MDKPLLDLMTKDVISVEIDASLTEVLQLMDQHQIHYLPVTENGSLRGIINMLDLVKYRLAEIEMEANALKDYVAGRARRSRKRPTKLNVEVDGIMRVQ